MPDNAGLDQMMRQHRHREPGGAADLNRVRIGRANAEMLGEHRRQHDVRRDGGIAAEHCARVSPASAIASAAALLMRSREEEPSCLPNAVSPTPVMKLMGVRFPKASSFRGGAKRRARNP